MATLIWARPPYAKRDVPEAYDRGWWQTELGNIQRAILPSSLTRVTGTPGTYAATATDRNILCDTTSGPITVTLPIATVVAGLELIIKKVAGNMPVTIAATVDGVANRALANVYDSITVVSDGNQWLEIAHIP